MRSILYIAAIILFFSSCERETRVNIPPHTPLLVAESQQGQNSFPQARISRSRGVTEPSPIYGQSDPYLINNAILLLYENDIFKDSLKYNSASEKYKAVTAKIQAGKTYKLTLSAQGFTGAEAISVTPSIVNINSIGFIPNARFDRDGYPQDEIRVSFTDNGASADYYLLRLRNFYGNYIYCVTTNDKDVEKLVYDDPLYPDDCLQSDRLLLADNNFNGNVKTVILYTAAGELRPVTTPSGILRATVELLHINQDFYKYIKSQNSYENATGNPFAEPVNLYSNVKNGYGFFTTYASVVDSIP